MNQPSGNAAYLRKWAADIRASSGPSVDADRLDAIAAELERTRLELDEARAALRPFADMYRAYHQRGLPLPHIDERHFARAAELVGEDAQ